MATAKRYVNLAASAGGNGLTRETAYKTFGECVTALTAQYPDTTAAKMAWEIVFVGAAQAKIAATVDANHSEAYPCIVRFGETDAERHGGVFSASKPHLLSTDLDGSGLTGAYVTVHDLSARFVGTTASFSDRTALTIYCVSVTPVTLINPLIKVEIPVGASNNAGITTGAAGNIFIINPVITGLVNAGDAAIRNAGSDLLLCVDNGLLRAPTAIHNPYNGPVVVRNTIHDGSGPAFTGTFPVSSLHNRSTSSGAGSVPFVDPSNEGGVAAPAYVNAAAHDFRLTTGGNAPYTGTGQNQSRAKPLAFDHDAAYLPRATTWDIGPQRLGYSAQAPVSSKVVRVPVGLRKGAVAPVPLKVALYSADGGRVLSAPHTATVSIVGGNGTITAGSTATLVDGFFTFPNLVVSGDADDLHTFRVSFSGGEVVTACDTLPLYISRSGALGSAATAVLTAECLNETGDVLPVPAGQTLSFTTATPGILSLQDRGNGRVVVSKLAPGTGTVTATVTSPEVPFTASATLAVE